MRLNQRLSQRLNPRANSRGGAHVKQQQARDEASPASLRLREMEGRSHRSNSRTQISHRETVLRCGEVSARSVAAAPAQAAELLASAAQSEGVVHRVQRWNTARLKVDGVESPISLPAAGRARQALYDLAPSMLPSSLGSGPVVYIDGETTGLGGASNRFCVIGIVYATASTWVCEQWVLAKLSYEAEFLRAVTQRLDALDPSAIVSFNGASFDLPLFRKRLTAQRDPQLSNWKGLCPQARPLVDLVHSARRVWKGRVPDCRLQTLERHFLGVRRVDDLPGKDVPKVYWAWLSKKRAAKEAQRMEQVLLHNLVDLAVMPVLAHRIAEKLSDPQGGEDALRTLCHSERAPAHPMFARAMHRWLSAGQPGAWQLREPRIQVWVRALEKEQERNAGAAPLLIKLLESARRSFPGSKWVFRRCQRWGLVSSRQERASARGQLCLTGI